jgi:hypothetical protein
MDSSGNYTRSASKAACSVPSIIALIISNAIIEFVSFVSVTTPVLMLHYERLFLLKLPYSKHFILYSLEFFNAILILF